MREDEYRAATLLMDILGAETWEARDVGPAQGMHDLNLVMPDGSVVAVEVTSDTSGNDRAFDSALNELKPIPAPANSGRWYVSVRPPDTGPDDHTQARRRAEQLQDNLPGLLDEIKRGTLHDDVQFIAESPKRNDSELAVRLRALGVQGVREYEADERDPQVRLVSAASCGMVGAQDIPDAARRHIPPNRDKLVAAKNDDAVSQAHLFVWLQIGQPHRSDATIAVQSGDYAPGDLNPIDPGDIDAVWVAVDYEPPSVYELRRAIPVYRFGGGRWTRWQPKWCPGLPN